MIDPVLLVLIVVGIVLAVRDPRRLLPGVLLLLGLMALVSTIVRMLFDMTTVLAGLDEDTRNVVLGLFILLLPVIAGLGLGVFLLINGLTMIRREQRSVANLLSLMVSLFIFGLFLLVWAAAAFSNPQLFAVIILFLPPLAYLGTGFFAYLGWSVVYAKIAKRIRDPHAVIVLGSGIRKDGTVTPLLGARVALGVDLLNQWPNAVGIMSGGQGADEPRSEAEAMADHARGLGAPADRILTERASRTTEENLLFSRKILEDRGSAGISLAVTSSFHAFRAATLMRKLGIDGQARGAKTAFYYLPSALLREYLAILRDHIVLNAVALGLSVLPGVIFVLAMLFS